jgi:hypothetical protein
MVCLIWFWHWHIKYLIPYYIQALQFLRHYDPDAENCFAARHIFSAARVPKPETTDGRSLPTEYSSVGTSRLMTKVRSTVVRRGDRDFLTSNTDL